MIMIESEGITENVRNWRTDVISAVTSALPKEKIMFEAADPEGEWDELLACLSLHTSATQLAEAQTDAETTSLADERTH